MDILDYRVVEDFWISGYENCSISSSEGTFSMATSKDSGNNNGSKGVMDNGKYVRYTPEQVEALERLYHDCPKPSSVRRQQLIRECPILSNIEPKQIKVWFQNRRYELLTSIFLCYDYYGSFVG